MYIKNRIITIIIILLIIIKPVYAIEQSYSTNKEELLNQLFQEVEYSYYMRGSNIQYNSAKRLYSSNDKKLFAPEEATTQKMNYLVCSGFVEIVYDFLDISIPATTEKLLDYAKNNYSNPEVIAYGYKENDQLILKINGTTIENPELNNILPYLKIGDILTYTGHTFLIYDLKYDENNNVIDAYYMESGHGNGYKYINTKTGNIKEAMDNLGITRSNWRLYYNNYDNSNYDNSKYGIENEGTLHIGKLSEETYYSDNGLKNKIRNRYSILRFLTVNENEIVLNYNNSQTTYNISQSNMDRIKFNKLYIEKIVNIGDKTAVSPNEQLTYTITIKNNSNYDYTEDLIVEESLSDYVNYYSYKCENCSFVHNDNNLSWNIGKLKTGEQVNIEYIVTVKDNSIGKTINSIGKVNNINSGTITNDVQVILSDKQKNDIVSVYNTLIEKDDYNGKKLINEIYKQALNIDLKLDEFEIENLINDTKKSSFKLSESVSINNENLFYNNILNDYWGVLAEQEYIKDSNEYIAYNLKYFWDYTKSNTIKANTIYKENFKTGDILIYKNSNDFTYNSNMVQSVVTYEDGEYAFIYIEGVGFVGKNIGNDEIENTNDDRNKFSSTYYEDNDLKLLIKRNNNVTIEEELIEFANYQTLLGKDIYVIIRPSLTFINEENLPVDNVVNPKTGINFFLTNIPLLIICLVIIISILLIIITKRRRFYKL